MTNTIAVHDAQNRLQELVHGLMPGEELILTEGDVPVAKLVAEPVNGATAPRPAAGFMRGQLLYMAPDFDAPLEDLREYMS